MSRIVKLALFSLFTLIICFSLLEIFCRIGLSSYIRFRHFPMMISDSDAKLRRDSTLGWVPKREGKFRGSKNVSVAKPTDTYRIITLGDSCTRGAGVYPEETYSAILENLLSPEIDYLRVEVLNAGVNGYKSEQVADYLETEILNYSPDLLVVYLNPFDTSDVAIDAEETLDELRKYHSVNKPSPSRAISALQDLFYKTKSYYLLKNTIIPLRDHTPDTTRLGAEVYLKRSANFMRIRLLCEMIDADLLFAELVIKRHNGETPYLWSPESNLKRKWESHFVQICKSMIESGLTPDELLLDEVHPTPTGHSIIASQLYDSIKHLEIIKRKSEIRRNYP